MKSVSSNLAKLKSNVEWAVLPLFDRTGWTRVRFGDVVENCAETCDPQGAELEQFITLSRGVCPRFLVIARSTIDSAAPKGQKEIAQGRAKRRPGYIAHRYRFRLKAGGNRSATTGRSPWINHEKADLKLYHATLFAKQRCALNVPRQLRSHPPPV
jgi:hypothetical protein